MLTKCVDHDYCEIISSQKQEIVMSWLAEETKQLEGEMSKESMGISRRVREKSAINRLLLLSVSILTLMTLKSCDTPVCAKNDKVDIKNVVM